MFVGLIDITAGARKWEIPANSLFQAYERISKSKIQYAA